MSKLRIISDMHLEFLIRDNKEIPVFKPNSDEKYLAILGDTASFKCIDHVEKFIKKHISMYEEVFLVMGNHDYWNTEGYSMQEIEDEYASIGGAITLFNGTFDIGDTTIIGSTLWSIDEDPIKRVYAYNNMNDFELTYCDNGRMRIDDIVALQDRDRKFIEESINRSERCIVLTHDAPSKKSICNYFNGNRLNGSFYTDCEHLISDKVIAWAHGHMHNPVDYNIGKTRVCSNPFGYSGKNYSGQKYIEF